MREAQKQPEDPWRDNQGPGKRGACSGSQGWELDALPKSDSSQPGKENAASVDRVSGRVVGCGVWWRWLCVCVGAACRCLQVQLEVTEPRHMAFLAEVSGFVSGVKAPLVPHWEGLQKAVCVWGGGSLLRCQLC